MTFIERRKARYEGSLETWYEVRDYLGRYTNGIYYGGETLATFKTKKEALEYCKVNNIKVEN